MGGKLDAGLEVHVKNEHSPIQCTAALQCYACSRTVASNDLGCEARYDMESIRTRPCSSHVTATIFSLPESQQVIDNISLRRLDALRQTNMEDRKETLQRLRPCNSVDCGSTCLDILLHHPHTECSSVSRYTVKSYISTMWSVYSPLSKWGRGSSLILNP